MNRKIIIACFLLAFSHLQLESATLFYRFWPSIANREYYPFWDSDYHFPGKMTIVWWIKYCSIDLKNLIVMGTAAWMFWGFSRRVGSAFMCYTLYYLTDHLMLWYNYRTSQWVYLIENGCIILSIILLFTVKERKGAKVKSLI